MTWEGSYCPGPWLHLAAEGESVSLTGHAWFFDPGKAAYSCTTWLLGQHFFLKGVALQGERFTVIAGVKHAQDSYILVDAQQATLRCPGLFDSANATDVIDVCAGYAVMTAGYKWIGCHIRCHVELNHTYAKWLKSKNIPVIEGDIDSTEVHLALVPFTTSPCICTGGFACQPFSQLGDRRQQLDPRAKSFEGMIKLGYLFQPTALVLECTKEAMTSPWVQNTLHAFCQSSGYKLQQQICHLQDFWPAKRTRWWAVVSHPLVQMPMLEKFPSLPFAPSFRHLLPNIAAWPDHQIQELQLSPHELEVFADQPGDWERTQRIRDNPFRPLSMPGVHSSWPVHVVVGLEVFRHNA